MSTPAFFPLKAYNPSLIRKPWESPLPKLTDYIIDSHGVDMLEPCRIEMWHSNDYVTFQHGIVILAITNHELLNGSFEIVSEQEISGTKQLTILNEECTTEHPGDWNIIIYALRCEP